jgi:hypothetical protein
MEETLWFNSVMSLKQLQALIPERLQVQFFVGIYWQFCSKQLRKFKL